MFDVRRAIACRLLRWVPLAAALALAACERAAQPNGAQGQVAVPVVGAPAPSVSAAPTVASSTLAPLPRDVAAGPLYWCDVTGTRTEIRYEPRVEALCRRHPEMGPCQYERDACRSQGGRVYAARGEEVTLAVEAEYDRIVRRVRFPAEAPAPAKR